MTDVVQISDEMLLNELKEELNYKHLESIKGVSYSVTCAYEAGLIIKKIKTLVPHTEFTPWLIKNFDGTLVTARKYKKLADYWFMVEPLLGASVFTIADAIFAINRQFAKKPAKLIDGEENINRPGFLSLLESIAPGLNQGGKGTWQSQYVLFHDGMASTFDGDLSCSIPCDFPISGAIKAETLLQLLKLMREEKIQIRYHNKEEDTDDGKKRFKIVGTRRRGIIPIEDTKDYLHDLDTVERPGKWSKLNPQFEDAVRVVRHSAHSDAHCFPENAIHIAPCFIEAWDGQQLCRFNLETGIKKECFVRADLLKHVVGRSFAHVSLGKEWIHFKNSAGLVMSLPVSYERHELPSTLLDEQGHGHLELGDRLIKAVQRARVFSQTNADSDRITVRMRKGKVKLEGSGANETYYEECNVAYTGKKNSFCIDTEVFLGIIKRFEECSFAHGCLIVDEDRFKYVACVEQNLDYETDCDPVDSKQEKPEKKKASQGSKHSKKQKTQTAV